METDLQKFKNKNAQLFGIAVQNQAKARAAVSSLSVSYPILADPDHKIADAFGVYNLLGDGVATPAVFIIDTSGHIVWSYVGQHINDRPNSQTILEHIPTS